MRLANSSNFFDPMCLLELFISILSSTVLKKKKTLIDILLSQRLYGT